MRQKMHDSHPNPSGLFDLKHDAGGIVDVEFMVQFLVLAHAAQHRELTRNSGNLALLKTAAELGLIPADAAEAVRDAYREFRRLQHALRLQSAQTRAGASGANATHADAVRQASGTRCSAHFKRAEYVTISPLHVFGVAAMSMADRDGLIWYDGKMVTWRDATTHVLTHTLHYGMGVFEGVRAYKTDKGTAIFRLKEHTDRLVPLGPHPRHETAVRQANHFPGAACRGARQQSRIRLPSPDGILWRGSDGHFCQNPVAST